MIVCCLCIDSTWTRKVQGPTVPIEFGLRGFGVSRVEMYPLSRGFICNSHGIRTRRSSSVNCSKTAPGKPFRSSRCSETLTWCTPPSILGLSNAGSSLRARQAPCSTPAKSAHWSQGQIAASAPNQAFRLRRLLPSAAHGEAARGAAPAAHAGRADSRGVHRLLILLQLPARQLRKRAHRLRGRSDAPTSADTPAPQQQPPQGHRFDRIHECQLERLSEGWLHATWCVMRASKDTRMLHSPGLS